MFKRAIASPASQIAGVTNTNCAVERISLEDFRGQVRIVPVPLGKKSTSNDDLAYLTPRNSRTGLILYADLHPIHRTASRDDTSVRKTRGGEDLDRNYSGLCRGITMSDAPIAFEMSGEADDVLCVEPLGRRPDETKGRKPKIVR